MAVRQLEQSEVGVGRRVARVESQRGAKCSAGGVDIALARLNGPGQILRRGKLRIRSNRQLNGDNQVPAAMQRPLYIGRNTFRGQNIYQVDARYSRIFPIGERIKPEFLVEAWNLFNHSNVTGYNTSASVDAAGHITGNPTFLQTAALDPRLLQLGVRVSW